MDPVGIHKLTFNNNFDDLGSNTPFTIQLKPYSRNVALAPPFQFNGTTTSKK
jgi:hypothetical protein